ncbi:smr domain-containing protein [Colletotrichum graminicola]|nr:smr domain-containing protein [Colletotrichum graminicola]
MNTSKIDALVAEFPLLDPTVVIVIASEVDLDDANQLGQVRGMLQSLAQNVLDEEASGFNASGVPDTIGSVDGAADARDGSTSPSERLQPKDTDSSGTTLTSSPPSEPDYDVPRIKTFDGDSDQEKLLQLQDMFSDLKPHDVKFALKKAQGDFQTALETLLNLQFLESIDERPKGVDGFFQSENTQPSGKKKGKRKKRTDLRSDPLSSSSSIKEGSPMNDDNESGSKKYFSLWKSSTCRSTTSRTFSMHTRAPRNLPSLSSWTAMSSKALAHGAANTITESSASRSSRSSTGIFPSNTSSLLMKSRGATNDGQRRLPPC